MSAHTVPIHCMQVLHQVLMLLKYPLFKDQTDQMSLFIYSLQRTTTVLKCVMSFSTVWWQPAASVQSRFGPFVSLIYLSCICVLRQPVALLV